MQQYTRINIFLLMIKVLPKLFESVLLHHPLQNLFFQKNLSIVNFRIIVKYIQHNNDKYI